MSDLIRRLRQRKLGQWSIAYLAGAWIAVEVVDTLGSTWGWPPLVGRLVFVGLAGGLAATLVLAWFHGERGLQRVTALETTLLIAILVAGGGAAALVTNSASHAPPARAATDAEPPTAGDPRALAVLPFVDLSPDGGREYLGDGIAEILINALGRLPELHVVARTSAFEFKGRNQDVREIGRRLGVGSVLDGSVAQVGDRVRVTANLYDAVSGLDRWSRQFDEEMEAEDLFVLQDEVARAILAALEVELGAGRQVVGPGTRSPEAQRAYFLGLHHWTARTTDDIARATEFFQQAIAADSSYADAWAGLALSYALHIPSEYNVPGLTSTEALDRAEATARRAIQLDSTLAAPHAALGSVFQSRGRPAGALREFRLAIEKNPGDATAHHWLADLLMALQRGEEALSEMETAESLDPVAPAILAEKAEALMILGRREDALAQMNRGMTLVPDSPLLTLYDGWFAFAADDWERAAASFARALELRGVPSDHIRWLETGLRDPQLRPVVLRELADGQAVARLGPNVADVFGRQEVRFLAILKADGPDAAFRFLRETIGDAERVSIYVPVLPAMMGPELSATPEARGLLRQLVETPQG